MKDVKIYDGAGWQSLKGPPGPSTPSADAGNLITVGSDGLLYAQEPPPVPSDDAYNSITNGSDGRLYSSSLGNIFAWEPVPLDVDGNARPEWVISSSGWYWYMRGEEEIGSGELESVVMFQGELNLDLDAVPEQSVYVGGLPFVAYGRPIGIATIARWSPLSGATRGALATAPVADSSTSIIDPVAQQIALLLDKREGDINAATFNFSGTAHGIVW